MSHYKIAVVLESLRDSFNRKLAAGFGQAGAPRVLTPRGGFAACERRQDALHQRARRVGAQFHRNTFRCAVGLANEVDRQRMGERSVVGVIEIYVRRVDAHPAVRPLGAARNGGFLDDVRAHGFLPGSS